MATEPADLCLRFRDWELRPIERVLTVGGQPAVVGSRAFDVLVALAERRGRTVSRTELLDAAWPGLVVEENNLSVQITALRKALGASAITTIPGLGYRLSAAPADEHAHEVAGGRPASSAPGGGNSWAVNLAPRHAAARGVQPPDPAAQGPQPGNLSAHLPPLFGRAADVSALIRRVRDCRLVSVVGAGGIGKTRLAQLAAAELQGDFADGAWMVELAPLSDPDLLPAAVAATLGLRLPGRRSAQEEVVEALRQVDVLLVLDNCEHVIGAASAFARVLLERTHHVRVMTTSQELLKLSEEELFRVSTLPVPETDDLAAAQKSDAVAMLISRIRALRAGFELDLENAAGLSQIVRRLDGLPLAIELAAARVPLLGVYGVCDRLAERFQLLTGGTRGGMLRHQALRATLEWSHGLLTTDEQAVFRRCGAFAGGFGLDQAQAVLGGGTLDGWTVLERLGTLVDKSLVVVVPDEPPRYRLLESARLFARENLQRAGEGDTIMARHARAMLDLFAESIEQRWSQPSQIHQQRYQPELDNARAALEWAVQSDRQLYLRLAGSCAWLFGAAGQGAEGMRHCEAALTTIDDTTPPEVEARLQYAWCGLAHYSPGTAKRAAADRAVTLYRFIGDSASLYSALGRLAITAALSGDCMAGEIATAEMQTLWNSTWPDLARWEMLNARDYVANLEGRQAEGEALANEQYALATSTQDTPKLLFALMALEQCAQARGDFTEAVRRGRELVARARGERYVEKLPVYIGNLATALIMNDELEEALPVAREAAEAASRNGTLWLRLDPYAMLAYKRSRPADAARILGRAESANAWRGAFREPVEQMIRDQLMAQLKVAIPESDLHRLLDQGALLDDGEAVRLALSD